MDTPKDQVYELAGKHFEKTEHQKCVETPFCLSVSGGHRAGDFVDAYRTIKADLKLQRDSIDQIPNAEANIEVAHIKLPLNVRLTKRR